MNIIANQTINDLLPLLFQPIWHGNLMKHAQYFKSMSSQLAVGELYCVCLAFIVKNNCFACFIGKLDFSHVEI